MTPINGRVPANSRSDIQGELASVSPPRSFSSQAIKEFVADLEVPFDPSVIEWRVTHTTSKNGHRRGQLVPYANPRAYTDRLNGLFTPAGWTRRYALHTSSNFQRDGVEQIVAKVFVTCDLTIYGLGSHSATGEEWADDANAGTSAEAQAFKRACSCFGLGRYLYYFSGIWVDLDDQKRPMSRPELVGWATPEGWRQGLRPQLVTIGGSRSGDLPVQGAKANQPRQNGNSGVRRADLIRQIQLMAEPLGRGLYRGLLKTVARVWNPCQIHDLALLQRVLSHMQAGDRGLRRLEAALEHTGREALDEVLRSLSLNTLDRVDTLEILHKIVIELEGKTEG